MFSSEVTNVNDFLLAVYQHFKFSYPKFYKMDKLSKLGWLTAEILLDGENEGSYLPYQKGIVMANANASLDADLQYLQTINDVPSPALFVYTLPNIVIGEICIRHGFKGENLFFIQPEFDADFISKQVSMLINSKKLDACLCGWVDVIGQNYKAGLFWVQRNAGQQAIALNTENLLNIFKQA